jgi:tetratricopeptide (TPR) repeat protein
VRQALLALTAAASALLGGATGGCDALLEAPEAVLPSDPRPDAAWLAGDATERAAWDALGAGKPVVAREKAEAALKAQPGSFLGHWVLAQVMHVWDGHHARAGFLYGQTRRMLEARFGERPTDAAARMWHKRVLDAQADLLGEMDDREGQLRLIAEHDALYEPRLESESIWPLMKLGRFDEALKVGEKFIYSDEFYDRVAGYNGIMAVHDERRDKTQAYAWGKKGIEGTQGRSCILLFNTAQSALMQFHFDAVEDYSRRAARAELKDCPSSTWEHLLSAHLQKGEFQKAISAYRKIRSHPIEPRYRQMFDKNNKALLAEILLALGKFEDALEYARIVFAAPDRAGMVSLSNEDIRFAHGILYWVVLDARLRQLEDAASHEPLLRQAQLAWERRDLALKRLELQRILVRLAAADELLVVNLRPFMRGVRPWYAGALGRIFGPGLASAALEEARALDAPHLDAPAMAYFDVVAAELAFHAGDLEAAAALARKAMGTLAKDNAVLLARAEAIAALSDAGLGEAPDAPAQVAAQKKVLQRFPGILRELGARLHVGVTVTGGALADAVAARVHEHARFATGGATPFTVTVEADGEARVTLCLASSDGFKFGCKETRFEDGQTLPDGASKAGLALDAFVDDLFSPRVELTSTDIHSLDGSPVRQSADEALKGILKSRVLDPEEER